ncbi:MAG: hypothetical protein ACJA2S_000370 [Cyclobacteriaceae bacterium]|jgi:hypothetical protein
MPIKQFSLALYLIFAVIHTSFCQEFISKGKSFLGGGLNLKISDYSSDLNNGNDTEIDNSLFSFSPYYGKFIKDKLAMGIQLNSYYSNINTDNLNSGVISTNWIRKNTTVVLSFFLRKYYTINEKFGAFIKPSLTYNHGFINEENNSFDSSGSKTRFSSNEGNNNSLSLGASLGLYYFIASKFTLEANLGNIFISKSFTSQKNKNERNGEITNTSSDSNSLDFNFVNQLSFDQLLVITYFF